MKTIDLVLHCYAERQDNQWQAFCLDLCLAAQADSFEDAKLRLDSMIREYVYDAVVGEDREHVEQLLLHRSAPLRYWVKYYFYRTLSAFGAIHNEFRQLFREPLPLPLAPQARCRNAA